MISSNSDYSPEALSPNAINGTFSELGLQQVNMDGVLGFCCCDETPLPKATWRGKDLFQVIIFKSHSVTEGCQGRNLEARIKAEAVEECCFPALQTNLREVLSQLRFPLLR